MNKETYRKELLQTATQIYCAFLPLIPTMESQEDVMRLTRASFDAASSLISLSVIEVKEKFAE